jgi:serine/threonine-protein kinase
MSELLRLARKDPQAGARLSAAGVPYELVVLCAKATAFDKADRMPTALAFHAALESWLDGERDLGRRREEAERSLAKARAAHEAGEPLPVVMRQLSRAVALAPDHEPALALLSTMMLEAAQAVPEGARRELEREAEAAGKRGALLGLLTYAAWFCMLPLALFVGVKSFAALALIVVPALAAMVVSAWAYRKGWSNGRLAAAIVSSFVCIAGFAAAFGPLLVLPGLLTANIMPLLHLSGERPRFKHLVLTCALLGLAIPLGLEWLGVVPPSYAWRDGTMTVLPRLIDLPPVGSTIILLVGSVLNIFSCHFTVAASVQQQLRARTEALSQTHVMQEVMPEALRAVAPRRLEGDFAASGRDSLAPMNAGRPSSY